MAEKTNSTKRMATSEKSKNPARPAASTPAKSSVRVDDTDMESGDESTGEEQEEDEEEERYASARNPCCLRSLLTAAGAQGNHIQVPASRELCAAVVGRRPRLEPVLGCKP